MTTEEMLKNAFEALTELIEMNGLRNDYDAYYHDLAQWGLGKIYDERGEWVDSESPIKPNPKDFGLC